MRRLLVPLLTVLLLAPGLAHAGDDDADEDAPAPAPAPKSGGDEGDDTFEDGDFSDVEGPGLDFRDEDVQEAVKPRGPGEDNADIYRKQQQKVKDMTAVEEAFAWEAYLKKYPKSLFKDRIQNRMDDLEAETYRERVPGSDKGATLEDAAQRELNFARPLQFAAVDPRSHVRAGVELGIPNWFAPRFDFEYAVKRNLSVHAGLSRELTNSALNAGAKYALVKSARTGTIVTGGADLRLYTSPSFVGVHPWVGAGQRFDVLGGLDVQGGVGLDAELRDPFGLRYEANLGASLQASPIVSAFAETSTDYKYLGNDSVDPFRFMVATFGMEFQAVKAKNAQGDGRLDVHLAANIPYHAKYWGFYEGAVTLGADWYL
jgi:hypothetical protein